MPEAAYIHVPFCRHRCGYCNFTVLAGRDDLGSAYLKALALELAQLGHKQAVRTLFIGGGTPTHLGPAWLAELLVLVRAWFPLEPGGEFSVEANPRDLSRATCQTLAAHGITRVSLGAQSFDPGKLRTLERDHTAQDIRAAVACAQEQNLDVSLDLIFGVPGESSATWQADLSQAVALAPAHVSTYGLTFERGTTFWGRRLRGELAGLGDDAERDHYILAADHLIGAGFEHYEVSNFSRPGRACRHNEVYWAADEYWAAGPGAARYVDGRREVNHKSPFTWMQRLERGRSPVAESETLSADGRAREALVLGLRRLAGIELGAFATRFGVSADFLLGENQARWLAAGYLERAEDRLRLTREGLLISDWLWGHVLFE